MLWNGKSYGMEGEFWNGIWKMLRMEWKIWKMEWKFVSHSNYTYRYTKTYNKLLSNALDVAYQYEYVAFMIISQCIHILLMLNKGHLLCSISGTKIIITS